MDEPRLSEQTCESYDKVKTDRGQHSWLEAPYIDQLPVVDVYTVCQKARV